MKNKKKWKIIRNIIFFAFLLLFIIVILCNIIIPLQSDNYLYDNIENIPDNNVGLILGASKTLHNGNPNLYFTYRIKAASELYHTGKIRFLVVSGDNSRHGYNEPEDMRKELIKNGVPDSVIYLDYAGFRTLDSIVRLEKIFGQKQFTIISQKFHNQRAVFIAKYYGLDVYGYNAKDVGRKAGFKTQVREKLARVKVFLDLLTGKKPKFLGESIEIA